MGWFSKVAKWALIGGGTVLSLIPGVGPLIGGGLIATGASIRTGTPGQESIDPVSNAATVLSQALSTAGAMTAAGQGASVINVSTTFEWIKKNWIVVVGILAAIFLLPTLFKRGR